MNLTIESVLNKHINVDLLVKGPSAKVTLNVNQL